MRYVTIMCFALAIGCSGNANLGGTRENTEDDAQPSTFGIQYRSTSPTGERSASCLLPGSGSGISTGIRLDSKALAPAGDPLPHLWVTTRKGEGGGDAPYEVEVSVVRSYERESLTAANKETIKRSSYDKAFAEASKTDAFSVTFAGKSYAVEVVGIPEGAGCPALEP